jgi:hypothetical protein
MILDTPITRAGQSIANAWTGLDLEGTVYVRFSHDGEVVIGDYLSPIYDFSEDLTLVEVRGTLAVPGSSSTVVEIYKNSSSIGSLTWGAGSGLVESSLSVGFSANSDALQVKCTTAGTDAVGISIRFRFLKA